MKVLFIGGTGVISSECSKLCVEKGFDVYMLNRGNHENRIPQGAHLIKGDIKKVDKVKDLLKSLTFDSVINFVVYTPDQIKNDYELFKDKTSQYIFISSASVYQKPPNLPIRETEPINNPYWEYSQNKIKCEDLATKLYKEDNFPVTIVRPSHTYDCTKIPLQGGHTTIDRMLRKKKIIIHGDGSSVWTLTHNTDFAQGFVTLIGKKETIGETYHITSDELLTWDQICTTMADAFGVEPEIVHIPSEFIRSIDKEWGDGLIGDKTHSAIFDNTKIKKLNPSYKAKVPFKQGAKEIADWYLKNKENLKADPAVDKRMDEMIEKYEKFLNG